MVSQAQTSSSSEIIYPDCDGQPVANNTIQFYSYNEVRQMLEQERLRAEQERLRTELAEQARQDAIPRLLGMGLTVEQVAEALGLSIEDVNSKIK
ncbi:MAG: hypothetical protein AAFO04_07730 [Cyanobacteria bacterium J06592_8]